jgi:RHS repeat-associated protein
MRGTLCRLAAALYFRKYKSLAQLILCGLLGNVSLVVAQSYSTATGVPSFAAPEPVEMGFADAANGRLHLTVHLGSYPQRGSGQAEEVSLVYDSNIWQINFSTLSPYWYPTSASGSAAGWNLSDEIQAGRTSAASLTGCTDDELWQDRNGTIHAFHLPTNPWNGNCTWSGSAYATDSSGFLMKVFSCQQGGLFGCIAVYAPDGSLSWTDDIYSGNYTDPNGHYIISKDSNGNYLTSSAVTGSGRTFWDTLGRTFVAPNGIVSTSQGTSQYQIVWTTIPLNTHFQRSGVSECASGCGVKVIQSITLPDQANSTYTFKYDCDSSLGNSACGSPHGQTYFYGEMISATLPTSATITYQWTMFKDSYNNNTRWLLRRYGSTYSSFTPAVITTCSSGSVGCQQKSTVQDGYGNQTVYTFTLNNGAWPVQIQKLDSQGNVLSTTKNTFDFSQGCALQNCTGAGYIRLLTTQITIPTVGGASITKQTAYSYDTPQTGNATAVKEWKFYPGTSPTFPSVPDRATYTSYLTTGTNNINRPLQVTICNNSGSDTTNCPGGGSRVSQQIYTYDSYSSCPSGLKAVAGVSNHDDSNFGVSYTQRGNPTQVQNWVSGSSFLTTKLCYDTTGQVYQSSDPVGNVTTYDYTDNFFNETGAASMSTYTPTKPTNAYVKTITSGGLTATSGYYFGSGKQAIGIDPNNQQTSLFFADGLDRATQASYPIGWSLMNYTSATQADAYAPVADTSASSGCTSCQHQQSNLDSWGRKVNDKLVNAPGGAVNVDTSYDGNGRLYQQSHAYVNTSDPSHVFETYSYDGLNRQIGVTHPDNQSVLTTYGAAAGSLGGVTTQQSSPTTYGYGYPVVSLDEAGKQRQQWIDGFGRIIEVDEPSTSAGTDGSATITVNGSEQSFTTDPCAPCEPSGCPACPRTTYDFGTVSVTVNGFVATANYQGSTGNVPSSNSVAATLVAALNVSTSPVVAVQTGTSIKMTAKAPGSNFSFTTAYSYDTSDFHSPSFMATPSSGSFTGGSGGISSSPQVTTYAYDAAGHLINVTQGVQTRTFTYDGLGRMTSRTTPEAGTDNFYFTQSGGVNLCAGSPKAVCRRTDARGITTTYAYNSRSQLTGKSYSNGQGSRTYQYDQGGVGAFALGRLTTVTDPSGSEAYTYNAMGWITRIQKTIGATTYPIQYGYNSGGQVTQITYPSGRVVQQNVDNIGLLNTIVSGTTTYASIPEPPSGYNPVGQLLTFAYGNGVVANMGYSSSTRDQMTSLSYIKGTTTIFSLNYGYMNGQANCGSSTTSGNDGQVQCIQDLADSGRSVVYGYDSLNRLISAVTAGSGNYAKWGLSEAYDRYGNRLNQGLTAGSGPSNSLSFATTTGGGAYTNRPDGYSFDVSGNMLNDGANSLAYDADNCLTSAGTATYTCDARGIRVKKAAGTTTVYVFSAGKDVAEYDNGAAVGSPSREYVYLGGQLLATIQGSTTVYHHRDHLSVRVTTDVNGAKIGEQGNFPYGENWYTSNTTTKFIFTSYERDPETGNDYAMARYYVNRFARFSCADPMMGRVDDPQTWNRYVYVRDNPVNNIDPSGLGFVSWLMKAFRFLAEAVFGLPHGPGLGGWSGGTPPIFGNDPISGTQATLNSIYNPQDPSKFATAPFLDPGTAYFDPSAVLKLAVKDPCAEKPLLYLDYGKEHQYDDGTTNAFQHIWVNHILPASNKSTYSVWPGNAPQSLPPISYITTWDAAVLLNAQTVESPDSINVNGPTVTYTKLFHEGDFLGIGLLSKAPIEVGPGGIGDARAAGGAATISFTNLLMRSLPDCSPLTSHPM